MKILLSTIPGVWASTCLPDIGLGYLATALRKAEHDVTIIQREKDKNFDKYLNELRELKPQVIGLKVYSLQIHVAKLVIEKIKQILPDAIIILGGPHISAMQPEQLVLDFKNVDFCIRGEGEISLPRLLNIIDHGGDFRDVPGIVMEKDGKLLSTPKLVFNDVDSFGMPAWDLIPPKKYNDRWHFWAYQRPSAPILTSRGCPYRCAFCAQHVIAGKKFRQRSMDIVFNELELLYTQYHVKNFDILDDNFLMDPEYVVSFCEEIIRRNWKINWTVAGARLDFVNKSLIKLMDKAGCRIISVGIESGNQRLLDYMLKDTNIRDLHAKIDLIKHQSSIQVFGMFIIGYPTETKREILKTIQFACKLPLTAANFFTYVILPGCLQHERLLESGEIQDIPWDKISSDGHEYVPQTMSKRELKLLYRWAYVRFYSRPHVFTKMLYYSWRSYKRLWRIVLNKLFRWSV